MDTKKLPLLCVAALISLGFSGSSQVLAQHHRSPQAAGRHAPVERADPLANATVSFGGWKATPHLCPPVGQNPPALCPPVDRFPPNPATQFPRFSNNHELLPEVARIRAGGAVNFIIGGLHVVTVYDEGIRPADIDITRLVPNRPPMTPPIIDDADGRIYRGLDPFLLPVNAQQDRVEVVQFDRPGLYLVICAVLPHFQEGMYGYVRVLGPNDAVAKAAK